MEVETEVSNSMQVTATSACGQFPFHLTGASLILGMDISRIHCA